VNNPNLDTLIREIQNEPLDEAVIDAATARVAGRVFAVAQDHAASTLRTCADFEALMRAYLTKTLPESRALLLEDHVHSCVNCRRALDAARTGKVRTMPRPQIVERHLPQQMKWAAAAVVALAAGLSVWGVVRMLPSSGTRATVQSVSGVLYAVNDQSSTPIFSGRALGDNQRVRTANNSTAVLRFNDGSLVEMNGRAELSITKDASGANIHLARGNVIVQAAKQRTGALYVSTPDCLVTVHGTVFAVTRGVKGTKVSVAEGEVKVDEGGSARLLHPGDQTATNPAIENTPVQDDFAWSRNSAKYLAALGELSTIQKAIAASPGPALRYRSRLLDLVPNNTVLYAAIPNLSGTLTEASRLFNERIQQNETLRQWWTQSEPNGSRTLQDVVDRLQTFNSYLGDEIILYITGDWTGKYSAPVLLAEVTRPGLQDFLNREAPPFKTAIKDNIVAISPDAASLKAFSEIDSHGFERNYFHNVIAQSYQSGVGWLFCANLEQILRTSVPFGARMKDDQNPTGLQDVRYLVFERKELNGQVDNRVALNFRRTRRGLASWLGAPGPMGSLDFVSPNALVAAGFVLKSPRGLVGDLFQFAGSQNSDFGQRLADFQHSSGVNVLNDLAAPLGTDAAFAIDGPLLPTPSWEFAMEVYSPDRLQWTIEKLIDDFNRQNSSGIKLTLAKTDVGGRTLYSLTGSKSNLEAHYAFADSYLIAGATQGMVLRAIQNRQNGYTLTRSDKFRAVLPVDQYPSFSGLIYHNIGPLIGPLANQLQSLNALSAAQKASIQALETNSGPGMVFAYGEPDRIVISGKGPLFGLSLNTLAIPNILSSTMNMKGMTGTTGMTGMTRKMTPPAAPAPGLQNRLAQ